MNNIHVFDQASLESYTRQLQSKLSAWRRHLHEHAEPGWCEYGTTAYIYHILSELQCTIYSGDEATAPHARLGIPNDETNSYYWELAKKQAPEDSFLHQMQKNATGIVATFDTGRPGKNIGFRFDIDALPIHESAAENHKPVQAQFRSNRDHTMHACGHDGHTSIGLGVATFLHDHLDGLSGTFTLLFQPSEEGLRGAKSMVEKGWLDNIDLFLSGHIMNGELGTVTATTSGQLASTKFLAEFFGQSSHAGMAPDKGKNTILAASHATIGLHGISRHQDGESRINVGKIDGGQGKNIIADHTRIEFETRGATTGINDYMKEEASRVIEGAAKMQGVDFRIHKEGEAISVPSDHSLITVVQRALADSNLITHIENTGTVNGSEDATFMLKAVQDHGGLATYMLYHSPLPSSHHQPAFDFDEQVLQVAVHTLVSIVVEEQ